jgi:hypothetical protein
MGIGRPWSAAAARGRRGLVRDVVRMAHVHHPVYRASYHVLDDGPGTDRAVVHVVVRVALDAEVPVIASLTAVYSSHNHFLAARFLVAVLTFLTIVSLGITEISW